MVVSAAAQQPRARDVDGEAENSDRDRLGEVRSASARTVAPIDFVADQQRDHRQHDGAGEAREIAELAGAEGEARIVGVAARVGVGERRQQQRAGVGAHVQAVGDQRDRAEHQRRRRSRRSSSSRKARSRPRRCARCARASRRGRRGCGRSRGRRNRQRSWRCSLRCGARRSRRARRVRSPCRHRYFVNCFSSCSADAPPLSGASRQCST